MLKQHPALLVIATVIAAMILFSIWPRDQATQAWEPAAPVTLQWSAVGANGAPQDLRTYRAAVPGGWLVCVYDQEERFRKHGAVRVELKSKRQR